MRVSILIANCALTALIMIGGSRAEDGMTRYVRFETAGAAAYGAVEGQTVHELDGSPFAAQRRTGRSFPLAAVKLLPPTEPSKVLAVALNYRSHAGDAGAAKPELFAKLPSSLVGPGDAIVAPPGSTSLHYEGELVVVIGKRAKSISPAEARAHIFGVTAGNDVSERNWQFGDTQWLRGKASDTFGPVGPMIVRGLDYNDLLVETRLNGVTQQVESTRHLIHDVDTIVSFASRYITLLPGDLIFTGTPGRTSAMRPGDTVEIEIQGIGVLRNPVVDGSASR